MIDKYVYYQTGSVKSINHDWVKEQLELEGYKMLSMYESINKPFKFICPNGHNNKITLNNWNQGKRCLMCAEKNKYKNDGAKSFFAEYGYQIIGGDYKDNRSLITYRCSQGHINDVILSSLKNGTTCPYCKGTRIHIDDVKRFLSDRGCTLIRPLNNFKSDVKVVYINHQGIEKARYWNNIKRMKKL
ncbi:hypothetical protein [Dolichospermum phage Dfl-JY23]